MAAETLVPLRITILNPVPGVALMLQKGRDETVAPSTQSPDAVTFDCTVRVRFDGPGTGCAGWVSSCRVPSPIVSSTSRWASEPVNPILRGIAVPR